MCHHSVPFQVVISRRGGRPLSHYVLDGVLLFFNISSRTLNGTSSGHEGWQRVLWCAGTLVRRIFDWSGIINWNGRECLFKNRRRRRTLTIIWWVHQRCQFSCLSLCFSKLTIWQWSTPTAFNLALIPSSTNTFVYTFTACQDHMQSILSHDDKVNFWK